MSAFPQRLRGLWHGPFGSRPFGGLPRCLWAPGTGGTAELLESIHFGGGDLHGRTSDQREHAKSTGTRTMLPSEEFQVWSHFSWPYMNCMSFERCSQSTLKTVQGACTSLHIFSSKSVDEGWRTIQTVSAQDAVHLSASNKPTGPHYVFCHSTGGMVTLLALNKGLAKQWEKLKGVVYSAPLIKRLGQRCLGAEGC